MEAIAGANRGGVAGCSSFREKSVPPTSAARNVAFYHPCSRTVRQISFSSAACFRDQGHVQFYRNAHNGGRGKDQQVACKAVAGGLGGAVDAAERNFRRAKKMEKSMEKKAKKAGSRAAAGVSSSSSSSSSSDSESGKKRRERGARSKRIDMERFGREWASISQSPLMDSVPTFSSTFAIVQQPLPPFATPGTRSGRDEQQQQHSDVGSSAVVLELMNRMMMGRGCDVQQDAEVASSAIVSDELRNRVTPMRMSSSFVGASGSSAQALLTVPRPQFAAGAAPVEVCMGGKCKKGGAQQVMSSLQANGVPACAAKCMKKCKLAINVRVQEDDSSVPQMYSGVEVADVNALSQKYFGAVAAAASRAPGSSSPWIGAGQA